MRSSEGDERLNNSHKKKTIISKDTISTSDEDDPFSQSTSSSPTKPTSVNKKAKYEPKKGINKSDDGRGEQEEKDDEDGHVIPISSKRRVTVRQWKSNVLVDIREFWGEEGDLKPGKKGKQGFLADLDQCP